MKISLKQPPLLIIMLSNEKFGKTSKNLKILALQLCVTFSFASIVFTNKSKFQKQLPLAKKHFIFLKRNPRPNLKVFEYQI